MLTRKHFEMIAGAVRSQTVDIPPALDLKLRIAKAIAAELKLTNPRFDAQVFVDACLTEHERLMRDGVARGV